MYTEGVSRATRLHKVVQHRQNYDGGPNMNCFIWIDNYLNYVVIQGSGLVLRNSKESDVKYCPEVKNFRVKL